MASPSAKPLEDGEKVEGAVTSPVKDVDATKERSPHPSPSSRDGKKRVRSTSRSPRRRRPSRSRSGGRNRRRSRSRSRGGRDRRNDRGGRDERRSRSRSREAKRGRGGRSRSGSRSPSRHSGMHRDNSYSTCSNNQSVVSIVAPRGGQSGCDRDFNHNLLFWGFQLISSSETHKVMWPSDFLDLMYTCVAAFRLG